MNEWSNNILSGVNGVNVLSDDYTLLRVELRGSLSCTAITAITAPTD